MPQLGDLQVEAVKILIRGSDIIRERSGPKLSVSWEDYKIMSELSSRMDSVINTRELSGDADVELFKQDINILLKFIGQGRQFGIFSWNEGSLLANAIEVFTTPPTHTPPEPLNEASTSTPVPAPLPRNSKKGKVVISDEN